MACMKKKHYRLTTQFSLLLCILLLCSCSTSQYKYTVPILEDYTKTIPDSLHKGAHLSEEQISKEILHNMQEEIVEKNSKYQLDVKTVNIRERYMPLFSAGMFPPPYFSVNTKYYEEHGAQHVVYEYTLYSDAKTKVKKLSRHYVYSVVVEHDAEQQTYTAKIIPVKTVVEDEKLKPRMRNFLRAVDKHFVKKFSRSAEYALDRLPHMSVKTICPVSESFTVMLPEEVVVAELKRKSDVTVTYGVISYNDEPIASLEVKGDTVRIWWDKEFTCEADDSRWNVDDIFENQTDGLKRLQHTVEALQKVNRYFENGEFVSTKACFEYSQEFDDNRYNNNTYRVKYLKKAAEMGDPEAQYYYAFEFFRKGANDPEVKDGIELLRTAVKNGHCMAKRKLALFYATGYGASKTPHVYILSKTDRKLKVEYIGTIDNNFKDENKVTKTYVEDAINALLQNETPPLTTTKAIGCSIKTR